MSDWQVFLVAAIIIVASYFIYEAWLWVYEQHWSLFAQEINGTAIKGWYADGWWILKFFWPFFSVGLIIGGGLGFIGGQVTASVMDWIDNKITAKKKAREEQTKELFQQQLYADRQASISTETKKLGEQAQALKQKQAALAEEEKKLQEAKATWQQTLQAAEAKVKAAHNEREDARRRAKRLQEENKVLRKTLKEGLANEFVSSKSGDSITPSS